MFHVPSPYCSVSAIDFDAGTIPAASLKDRNHDHGIDELHMGTFQMGFGLEAQGS